MNYEITRNDDGTVLLETIETEDFKAVNFGDYVNIEFKPGADEKLIKMYEDLMK